MAYAVKTLNLDHDMEVKIVIFDTNGNRRFDSLSQVYIEGAHAVIVVYDITDEDSFETARSWVERLQEESNPNIFVALVGNKADLASARIVKYEVIYVCCKVHVHVRRSNFMMLNLSCNCVRLY